MQFRDEAARAADRLACDEFVARYDHPFLVVRIETDEDSGAFATVAGDIGQFALTPPPSPTTALVGESLAPRRKRPGANEYSFITLGRASNNDVVVALNSVSKCHAVINRAGDGYTIADARSKNGTLLNSRKLAANEPTPIVSGDTLVLSGRVTITFMDAPTTYAWLRAVTPG